MDPLADVYDEVTLRRVDRAGRRHRRIPDRDDARRGTAAVAVAGAMALGLAEVFSPREVEAVVEEIDPTTPDVEEAVTLYFVPGLPHRSIAWVRPWLLPGAGAAR